MIRKSQSDPKPAARKALETAKAEFEFAQTVLRNSVKEAHEAGMSWAEIGELFGTSAQAAHQRFAKYVS